MLLKNAQALRFVVCVLTNHETERLGHYATVKALVKGVVINIGSGAANTTTTINTTVFYRCVYLSPRT